MMVYISPSVQIDFCQYGVWRNGSLLPLPACTWRILAVLVQNAGTVISQERLLAAGWPNEIPTPTDLFRHIHRIRVAIEEDWRKPTLLITRRGLGYCLNLSSNPVKTVSEHIMS